MNGRTRLAVVLIGLAVLLPLGLTGAYHLDEIHALRLVTDFGAGQRTSVRPGLLWLLVQPLLWLGQPDVVALGSRVAAVGAGLGGLLLVGRTGWLAPALLLTSASWLSHGWEFRTDSFTTPLTLLAGVLFVEKRSVRSAVLGGLCLGAMALMSQKTVFNAAGLGVGWLVVARGRLRAELPRMAAAGATTLAVMGAWYGTVGGGGDALVWQVDKASGTAFRGASNHADRWEALVNSAIRGPAIWLVAPVGVIVAARKKAELPLALGVAGLVMVASIAAHRGFRVYYAASMEPLLAPAAALAIAAAGTWRWRQAVVLGVAGAVSLSWMVAVASVHNGPQLALMRAAHEAFDEPVPYWDSVGSVPGYPESTWFGTAGVRKAWRKRLGNDAFVERARAMKPHFFVKTSASRTQVYRKGEARWLWRHYLPYRDNLWLHGGRISRSGDKARGRVELLVDGEYTVWFRGGWTGAARVDGQRVRHGDVLDLAAGKHELRAEGTGGELWLILGAGREPLEERVDWSMFPTDERERYRQFDKRGSRNKAELLTPPNDPTVEDFDKRKRRHEQWLRNWDKKRGK